MANWLKSKVPEIFVKKSQIWERIVELSRYMKDKCQEYNLKCCDTLFNRAEKFDRIIEDIKNN
jgi:hypothetical protein